MTPTVNLRFDEAKIARRLQGKAPAAIARALNRSAGSGVTVLVRKSAADLGIKQAFVRDRIKVKPAQPGPSPVATITATAKRLPVYAFSPSPKLPPSKGRGRGVSWRGKGRRVSEPSAFIARTRSGHVGVFTRAGESSRRSVGAWSKNLPIRELLGPSVWHVATKHTEEARARAMEQLVKNVRHELRYALTQ
jgi:hypothetical protein